MIDEFKLAELLNSRYCHDLAGPIGAVLNGVEFLNEESEVMRDKAKNLITESAQQSVARLKFYRQVYGALPQSGDADLSYLKELALEYFRSSKITLIWDLSTLISNNIFVSHRIAKLILNFMVIATSTLIKGGEIKISIEPTSTGILLVKFRAIGDVVKFDKEFKDIFDNKINLADLSSKNIQAYYSKRLINATNSKLKIAILENAFNVEIEAKNQ